MICLICKNKIPLISNLNFGKGKVIITLLCQCNNTHEEYDIQSYLNSLNSLSQFVNNEQIEGYKCFIHKKEDVELFCSECSKDLCHICNKTEHINHQNFMTLKQFWEMAKRDLNYFFNIQNRKQFMKENLNLKYSTEYIDYIYQLSEIIIKSFLKNQIDFNYNYATIRNALYFVFCLFNDNHISYPLPNSDTPSSNKTLLNINHQKFLKINELTDIPTSFSSSDNLIYIDDSIIYYSHNRNELSLLKTDINPHCKKLSLKSKQTINLDSKLSSNKKIINVNNSSKYFILTYMNSSKFILYEFNKRNNSVKQFKTFNQNDNNLESNNSSKKYIFSSTIYNHDQILITITVGDSKMNFWGLKEEGEQCIFSLDSENDTIYYSIGLNQSSFLLYINHSKICAYNYLSNKKYDVYKFNSYDGSSSVNKIVELKNSPIFVMLLLSNYISVFDIEKLVLIKRLKGHKKYVIDFIELKDKRCMSASEDNQIFIWNFDLEYQISLIINIPHLSPLLNIWQFGTGNVIAVTREYSMWYI